MKQYLFLSMSLLFSLTGQTQSVSRNAQDTSYQGGAWARLEVEDGDSTFVMSLRLVKIASRRKSKDLEEQQQFMRYTFAARKVYAYAMDAINLYEQIDEETTDMSKRKRRRYIRHENKEVKEDMTETMKNLSKTEGKVLIKMIESQLNMPFYDIIRKTRGGTTAVYWNTLGKIWGYDLKAGYKVGDDILLDDVLLDYDFGDMSKFYGG